LLATPVDADDVAQAVAWARQRGLPTHVLGNGSNLLVRDAGVRGLVLRIRKVLNRFRIKGTEITAGAGASFPGLANVAAEHGLSGLEFAAGIPGTVGGAIVMNAGWHEHETGRLVVTVDYLEEDGIVVAYRHDPCRFAYRNSAFRGRRGVVLSATLALAKDDPVAIHERLERFAESRRASQPTDLPSCGSVFLKPEGDFAGRLIEAAGLKGRRVGGIQVSPKHANFFVNLGGGTAKDALALADMVEVEVERQFGVRLTRVFELWETPLPRLRGHQAPDALDEARLRRLIEDHAVNFVHQEAVEERLLVLDDLPDSLLDRAAGDEVQDLNAAALPHAVHATDPLLEHRRIPRNLEIDDNRRGVLEVEAEAAGIGREEHALRGIGAEALDGRKTGSGVHAAVEDRGGLAAAVEQRAHDVVGQAEQALPLAEDQDLGFRALEKVLEDVRELLEFR
jgi:UDP-N-acetylmuramate dehydrogenase